MASPTLRAAEKLVQPNPWKVSPSPPPKARTQWAHSGAGEGGKRGDPAAHTLFPQISTKPEEGRVVLGRASLVQGLPEARCVRGEMISAIRPTGRVGKSGHAPRHADPSLGQPVAGGAGGVPGGTAWAERRAAGSAQGLRGIWFGTCPAPGSPRGI